MYEKHLVFLDNNILHMYFYNKNYMATLSYRIINNSPSGKYKIYYIKNFPLKCYLSKPIDEFIDVLEKILE